MSTDKMVDSYTERYEAQRILLADLGLSDAHPLGGGMMTFGAGISTAAVCQGCGALVPVIGAAPDVGEAATLHAKWHDTLAALIAYSRKPDMPTDDL